MSSNMAMAMPLCPRCERPMVVRSGKFGTFLGCSRYPECRGTREIADYPDLKMTRESPFSSSRSARPQPEKPPQVEQTYEPIVKMPGSPEQEKIWKGMNFKNKFHVVVDAVAGSGKTWTMLQGCLRAPKDAFILFVAFNKHIAREAQGKLKASGCKNVRACTYHSLGYGILRDRFPTLKTTDPNDHKVTEILESICPPPPYNKSEWRKTLNLAQKLVSISKNYMLNAKEPGFQTELERLADHHGIDMNGLFKRACELVPETLYECVKRASVSIDYDDMVWLPIEMDLPVSEQVDMMITDESQDLNLLQHELTFKVCFRGRIVIVGDTHQAIYGFRGASTASMQTLAKRLGTTDRGMKEFPLTVTRRCPMLHVSAVQTIVPQIKALDDAPMGEILVLNKDEAIKTMKPGDMAICRVNAELIPTAYALIKRGIKAVIKGRDIGQGLLELVEKLEMTAALYSGNGEMAMLAEALSAYRFTEESKLLPLGDKAEGRLNHLHDKCDCLMEFISNSTTIAEMKQQITTIFEGEENPAIILGSIHRTKGLEAERVFILAPELLPGPWAKKQWERDQEANCAYIAGTRAKYDRKTGADGTLVFVGSIPPIFGGPTQKGKNNETEEVKDAQDACADHSHQG